MVADPNDELTLNDSSMKTVSFQIDTIAVVTHGLESGGAFPAWVTTMANSLSSDGFQQVIPFNWAAESNIPTSGPHQ